MSCRVSYFCTAVGLVLALLSALAACNGSEPTATPAVIAMQFEITDKAALAFADELYPALVDGLPVDAAVAEARTAIYTLPSDIEWGTPVLYMRAADGVLFDAFDSAEPVGQGRPADETGTTVHASSRPRRPASHEISAAVFGQTARLHHS
ncbi:MAG: CHAT domain-containing protein [Proteobacteria bacterium]|nr:CHAT domain-containing protein [Pseudomonadota bacterium]